DLMQLGEALNQAREQNLFRAEHLTHLRCEIPSPDAVESLSSYAALYPISLISLMDHTPGQRQFRDLEKYLTYYMGKRDGSVEEFKTQMQERVERNGALSARNRPDVISFAHARGIPLASHDDTTLDEVAQSLAEGVSLAEFPTTLESATALRDNGISVMMGAPNIIRGGSHSGNLAALDAAANDCLDLLSSDYVPGSLLMAAFELPEKVEGIGLHDAIATVTRTPAHAAGLHDRGE